MWLPSPPWPTPWTGGGPTGPACGPRGGWPSATAGSRIIDLSERRRPAHGRRRAGPDHRLQRLHLQLRGAARPSWPATATASSPTATPRCSSRRTTAGATGSSSTSRACSPSPSPSATPVGSLLARDRLGIKPLYLAEVAGRLRFASTLPALLAGGGVDTRIDPVALHHYLTFHSVVPPPLHHPPGVSQKVRPAIAGGLRARRAPAPRPPTGAPDLDPADDRADWTRAGLGGRRARRPAPGRRAPAGGRRPGRLPALRRPRLQPHRRAAGRGRPDRAHDLLHRLRVRGRRRGRRVQVLRRGGPALRHRPPPDADRRRPHAARPSATPSAP